MKYITFSIWKEEIAARFKIVLCRFNLDIQENNTNLISMGVALCFVMYQCKMQFTISNFRYGESATCFDTSSLAYGPHSLTCAPITMIPMQISLLLSSSISWHPSISDHSQYSPSTLILVFLLFFFHLVCPDIHYLRSYRQTFLPHDQQILVFFLLWLLQYSVLYIQHEIHNNFGISSHFDVVLYRVFDIHIPMYHK